jgi:nicotinamidase-related amidase
MHIRAHRQCRLLIDVLTTFQFPDEDAILQSALRMRDPLVRLKGRARKIGIPVIYVNDNFGDWRSEKEVLIGGVWRRQQERGSNVQLR